MASGGKLAQHVMLEPRISIPGPGRRATYLLTRASRLTSVLRLRYEPVVYVFAAVRRFAGGHVVAVELRHDPLP